jgi:hypothetical protein
MTDEAKPSLEPLYTLKQAAEKFMPAGFSAKALRTEIGKGNLIAHTIAGKICVTESALAEMVGRCALPRKGREAEAEAAEKADKERAVAAFWRTMDSLKPPKQTKGSGA